MISKALIEEIVEEQLRGSDLFLVEVKLSPSHEIEVTIDSDTHVGIDRCVELSKAIEERLNRDEEDFELLVSSAGIGQPFRLLRQYEKMVGREVELILKDGRKLVATLMEATDSLIRVQYTEKVLVEGKKRKELQTIESEFTWDEVKSTTEHLNFK